MPIEELVSFTEALIPAAAEAERLCFSMPWSCESLRMLTCGNGCGVALLCDGQLAAYGGMLCVLDEADVANIATLPQFRRRGYARKIMSALYDEAKKRGITRLTLEVRESNAAARALYISEGFTVSGVRPGYYFKPREAAGDLWKKRL